MYVMFCSHKIRLKLTYLIQNIITYNRFRAWRSAATRNLKFSTNCPAAFCQTRVMG